MSSSFAAVSIVIPTYGRDDVLVDTISLLKTSGAFEILIVDQTRQHEAHVEERLHVWSHEGIIRWIRLPSPGVVDAMNRGIEEARGDVILFLDDDIVPDQGLIDAHCKAFQAYPDAWAVAGRVVQPEPSKSRHETSDAGCLMRDIHFDFSGVAGSWVENIMAGNLAVRRERVIELGGFDHHFIPPVSFRFETEFARRLIAAGGKIRFEPSAVIHHLRAPRGGTRAIGSHLTSASPLHGVGDYYYALKCGRGWERLRYIMRRPFREVCTKFHLRHPWWIPVKFVGEVRALCMALNIVRTAKR